MNRRARRAHRPRPERAQRTRAAARLELVGNLRQLADELLAGVNLDTHQRPAVATVIANALITGLHIGAAEIGAAAVAQGLDVRTEYLSRDDLTAMLAALLPDPPDPAS